MGIKFKAIKNRKRLTARSYISDKAKKSILILIKQQVKELQKRRTALQVSKFNSVILGIQNYYRMATMVNIDFSKIGYIVNKSLVNRIGKPSDKKNDKYKLRYKGYNFKVWNVAGTTVFTLQAIKFKIPKLFSAKKKVMNVEKQIEINEIEDPQIRAILRVERNSTCEVTGEYIKGNNNFYVHRIVPKEHGGSDDLDNLMLLESSFKTLLKSKNREDYYKDNENYAKILKTLSKYK
ncbi:MAG: HNH endonuclease signature motif containing protein [Cetobacterium sp.]